MNFQEHYLEKTMNAIKILKEAGRYIIDVKLIRRINNVKASNRSDINFYWNSLQKLEEKGFLKLMGDKKPKKYKILED